MQVLDIQEIDIVSGGRLAPSDNGDDLTPYYTPVYMPCPVYPDPGTYYDPPVPVYAMPGGPGTYYEPPVPVYVQ